MAIALGPSYWHSSLESGDTPTPRAQLPGDVQAHVAVVGAGFAGLWTAYYLLKADPARPVVVLDAETAGFGASGRNGGWCVPEAGAPLDVLDKERGAGAGAAMLREMHRAVDEIGAVAVREGIDCGYAKGGALWMATDAAQLARARSRHALLSRHGFAEDYQVLDPIAAAQRVNATGIHGAIFAAQAAALHPARLARGLARAIERLGGKIYEKTPALRIDGRSVTTPHGKVSADIVVRATEAYTGAIEGVARTIVPIGNFVIATAPMSDAVWSQIGVANRELFEDTPELLAYGQRTADGRIVWGGLGAQYRLGSNTAPPAQRAAAAAKRLHARLITRFPALRSVEITHCWHGVMGMTRDLRSTVGYDRAAGQAWASGFGGAGVAPTNTAGRTLADLITGADSALTRLAWVNHRSPIWEREPLRWFGINTTLANLRLNDVIARLG